MALYFITGNKNKLAEAKAIIPEIEQIELDLLEIQELDPKKIIEEKLKEAIKQRKGEFFCEDTSLYINCLNGFPGPLIKWFLHSLKNEGIAKLVENYSDKTAIAKTIVGYADGKEMKFFEGEIEGEIVEPVGKTTFGWDPIFKPKGYDKTFNEMSREDKNRVSMRKIALEKLKDYLDYKKD